LSTYSSLNRNGEELCDQEISSTSTPTTSHKIGLVLSILFSVIGNMGLRTTGILELRASKEANGHCNMRAKHDELSYWVRINIG
jgi:hypothetical protein